MPFTNPHHGGAGEPFDLAARIDAELRGRIEEAVDYACLEAMVRAREGAGAPAPVADSPRDREEFMSRVRAFLERLRAELGAALSAEQQRRIGDAVTGGSDDMNAALGAQVALAKELPDYWQRFEAIRTRQTPDDAGSGSERRGLLDRFLRRG